MRKTRNQRNSSLEQASRLIQSANAPLLICHVAPDADAIGSETGLGRALQTLSKDPILACPDAVSSHFHYIPGAESIVDEVEESFDLVISVDCSDRERLGHLTKLSNFDDVPILNIDHHLTNTHFGDVNLVDPNSSSTAEVVLRLLEYMGIALDREMATSLLTGIVADTRGFRTSNVTVDVMEAAVRLMKAGAVLPYLAHHSLDRRPVSAILLWREALKDLQIDDGVIWTTIALPMREAAGYGGSGDAGLVSFLISAQEAHVAAVFVEREDGDVEVGLRADVGFDVARVALEFGGGGHALAAGCTLSGPMDKARKRFLYALREDLIQQQRERGE